MVVVVDEELSVAVVVKNCVRGRGSGIVVVEVTL